MWWTKIFESRFALCLFLLIFIFDQRSGQSPRIRSEIRFQIYDQHIYETPDFFSDMVDHHDILCHHMRTKQKLCVKFKEIFFSGLPRHHIYLIFYTNTFLGLKMLHSKVHKFTTKKGLATKERKLHIVFKITYSMCNYTLCVKLHTVCKIAHSVWNYTLCVKLHSVWNYTVCV